MRLSTAVFRIAFGLGVLFSPLASQSSNYQAGAEPAATFTCTDIPQSQCDVLSNFFNLTNGKSWTISDWGTTTTACGWHGVTCRVPPRFGDPTVIEIALPTNNLTGHIDVQWANLPALQTINLGSNHLSGSLPSSLGSLSLLSTLNLSSNDFTGTIPAIWGSMSSLTTLDVSSNVLSGELPTELGDLAGLTWLNLRDNDLSGSLPESLVNLTSLTYFWFDKTYLCIPNSTAFTDWLDGRIGDGTGRSCILCRGALDPLIGGYRWSQECLALVALYDSTGGKDWTMQTDWLSDLGICSWEGVTCIPAPTPSNPFRQVVSSVQLPTNNLAGTLPDLSALAHMTNLDLSGNTIGGWVPDTFGSLVDLQSLKLSNNPLTGSLPPSLTNLIELNQFHFNQTGVCIPPGADFQSWLDSVSDLQSNGQFCQPGISVDVTLSPSDQSCPGVESLEVTTGTSVRYCYAVTNTGELTLNLHYLIDSEFGTLFQELSHELAPDATYTYSRMETAENTATRSGHWTAYNGSLAEPTDIANASDSATLTVYQNSISLDMTVSLFGDGCPGSNSLTVPAGTQVEYCYEVTNTGEWTLTLHHLNDSKLGNVLNDYAYELTPGASISVSSGAVTLNDTTISSAFWTAYNEGHANAIQVNDTVTVTVSALEPSISLDMTVSPFGDGCPGSDSISVPAGSQVKYCYSVTNTGEIPLNLHDLVDSELGTIVSGFPFELAPGATSGAGVGPVVINSTTMSTGIWTAYNEGPTDVAEDSDSVTVTVQPTGDTIFADGFED